MSGQPWWWLLLAAVLGFWMLGAYNRLVALRSAVGAAWLQLAEVLQRRAEAQAGLLAALREPLQAESGALDSLQAAQAQHAQAAQALGLRPVQAELALALQASEAPLAASAARVLALLEQQDGLAQSAAVAPALLALRETEPRLLFARQLYNEAAAAYDLALAQWPTRLLTRLYGFKPAGRL